MKKICYIMTVPITARWFFIDQMQYMAANGWEVSLICSDDGAIGSDVGEGVRFIPANIPRGVSAFGSLLAVRELKRIFLAEKFDVIQYSTVNASLYAALAGYLCRVPVRIFHLMGARYKGFSNRLLRFFYLMLEKVTSKLSTHVECVSPSNKEEGIRDRLLDPNKTTVIWNGSTSGVDFSRFSREKMMTIRAKNREDIGIGEQDIVFGYIGRITQDKGINELFMAFRKLADIRSDVRLLLAGFVEEEQRLDQHLLKWARLDERVVWLPNDYEVLNHFSRVDVLVLPTHREGFGNVIIEAEALGIPVIASRVPGPVDAMVDGETGLFFACGNPDDLEYQMLRLCDSELRETMGRKGICFAKERFDSTLLFARILERKNELVDKM